MMIYNKIFLLLFTIFFISTTPGFSIQTGRIEYSSVLFDYSKLNYQEIKNDAETYFVLYKKNKNSDKKEQYLNLSAGKYYLLTKIDNSKTEPYVQLGRIYDEKNKPRLAKENFCKAINLQANDPLANYFFGEFYYKRNEYKKALNYYQIAYENGLNNTYTLNLRMATIYEKFADLINAKKFYDISYSMKPTTELQKKIRSLNNINYENSEYYRDNE